jgi:hypothetical protein
LLRAPFLERVAEGVSLGRLSIDGMGRAIGKEQFEEFQIQPAAEFIAYLPEVGDFFEAEGSVQADTGVICRVDRGYDGVKALATGSFYQGLHQQAGDTLTAMAFRYIDGIFNSIFVGGPGPERAIGTESEDATFFFRDEKGVAVFYFGVIPGLTHLQCLRNVLVYGRSVQDNVVVYFKDGGQVCLTSGAGGYHCFFLMPDC